MTTRRPLLVILAAALAFTLPPPHIAKADPGAPSSSVYNFVFIGDSITHGAGTAQPAIQAAPVICGQLLQRQLPGASIYICNQGYVGYTALGIHGIISGVEKTITAFAAAHPGQLVFSIMLGTNDSANSGPKGVPTSASDYRKNLKSVIDELLVRHPDAKIFLQRPIWYSPNTHSTGADYEGGASDRLKSYFPEITALAADYAASRTNQVFEGDTQAYDYFAAHYKDLLSPQAGLDGTFYLHPNAAGAASLGKFWADAIASKLGH